MRWLFQYMNSMGPFSVIYENTGYCIFWVCIIFKLQVTERACLVCLVRQMVIGHALTLYGRKKMLLQESVGCNIDSYVLTKSPFNNDRPIT